MAVRLVRVYATLTVAETTESLFAELAERSARLGEGALRSHFVEGNFTLEVRVTEGSARTRLTVLATAAWLVGFLGDYEDVFAGLDRLKSHSQAVGSAIRGSLRDDHGTTRGVTRMSVDTADVRRLRSIVDLVADGTLTAEAAMEGILRTVQSPGDATPAESLARLHEQLKRIERDLPADALRVAPRFEHYYELEQARKAPRDSMRGAVGRSQQDVASRPKLSVSITRTVRVRR